MSRITPPTPIESSPHSSRPMRKAAKAFTKRQSATSRSALSLQALAVTASTFIALAAPMPAAAGDLVLGLGHADFKDPATFVVLEVHSRPHWRFAGADWSLAVAISDDNEGDVFVGVGPAGLWQLPDRWFIEASVMPGYFNQGNDANDLGSEFEIRSLLGIGRKVSNGLSLSLALSHTSNADTAKHNPGVNQLSVRLRRSF